MPTQATLESPTADRGSDVPHHRVAIVGTGFTGLAMVHTLREAGIEDWIVIEKADRPGWVARRMSCAAGS